MGCNQRCGLMTVAVIGAVLAILGGILIPVGNHLVEKTIKKQSVIEEGTVAYQNWVVPGSPIYRQFWIFDVQNPEDVMMNGSAPILKQKGPYTYRMRYKSKVNITKYTDDILTYFQPNIVRFEPGMSIGSEEDNVTTVNLAVVVAPTTNKVGFVQAMMNIYIKSSNSHFLQTRTVKEILWGYEDPFLKKIPIGKIKTTVGVFYPYNETFDGPYRIYSGKCDLAKKGNIFTYNNSRTVTRWKSYCDMVNGTDGASFHPFLDKSEDLQFFSSDICRSMSAKFESEQMVKGIPLYRYVIPSSAFASPVINPDNICFCTRSEKVSQNCTLGGVLDISACKAGKPVYISLPHFLHASQEFFQYVEGLKPDAEEHKTFLDVEPNTGFTLHFAKRLQINLLVRPNSKITALQKIRHPFIFPILWLNETAVIGEEKADLFRSKVTNKIKLLHFLQLSLMLVGSVVFLAFLIAFFLCKVKSPK
ncbi:platelet glycoprotein 4-like [Erythrolamprus reginae]|uniref:platelet glycoprotein 4-like n=1 Tax=Erythrolamprus reginae TaxID=121349 RepID=UPI00396CEC84